MNLASVPTATGFVTPPGLGSGLCPPAAAVVPHQQFCCEHKCRGKLHPDSGGLVKVICRLFHFLAQRLSEVTRAQSLFRSESVRDLPVMDGTLEIRFQVSSWIFRALSCFAGKQSISFWPEALRSCPSRQRLPGHKVSWTATAHSWSAVSKSALLARGWEAAESRVLL
ncbi:hypothetical protein BSL78_03551 [Apostichopus japonicus]|uniref:Uncharacterized protein n=1 Tax=Stichopus japonicus TaxID=307972 RepID=A0A2G8LGV2_STIJA|nr:hypothetical protein BSL78_03551 [Apostichopus japonicus]